jgi:hypothetical protein
LVSCHKSRRPWSIYSPPASQVESTEVEFFLEQSRFSKSQCGEVIHRVFVSIRTHNLQILGIEQGSNPGSIEAFCYASLCCYRERRMVYTELSRSYPHHGQFFRPLNLICVSVTTERRRDATPPSFSTTVLTTLRPHGSTFVELVLSTPDTRLVKRPLQPRSGLKGEALYPEPLMRKLHVRPSSASSPFLFFLQLALATLPLAHLPRIFCSSPSKLSSVFVHDVRRSSEVDQQKNSSQAATHDSVFGRVRVFSLDLDRDVSLYHRQNLSAISCSCAPSSAASS